MKKHNANNTLIINILNYISMKLIPLIGLILLMASCTDSDNQTESPRGFVRVTNGQFTINKEPYRFIGVNYWYGMYLGAEGNESGRERLVRELNELQALGVNNLRIQASSEGDSLSLFGVKPALQDSLGNLDEKLLVGLDFLLAQMAERNMYAVLVLNNYWPWTGGMAQYNKWYGGGEIPYPNETGESWGKYMSYTSEFIKNEEANDAYKAFIKKLVIRKNTLTGTVYKNDPTIMAWQLANEPRGGSSEEDREIFINWLGETAEYIKDLDKKHLVSVGSEGIVGHLLNADDYFQAHKSKYIDYLTLHLWPETWQMYDKFKPEESFEFAKDTCEKYLLAHLEMAKKLNKPAVLEEFGLARDNGAYSPDSAIIWRNKFFEWIFAYYAENSENYKHFAGINIWGWSGEGRPAEPGAAWKTGDVLIGDPPHEPQGIFAIYNSDMLSLQLIANANRQIGFKPKKE
ncbi:MAG TPA: hypothetical protein DCQ31_06140 [Bacteroidales bacterium]|nr:hypothetical protein [Bacteroidales bacterium]